MVKLRGINVFPQALTSILAGMPGFTGEYVCVVQSDNGRDEMTVRIECTETADAAMHDIYAAKLKQHLGVEVLVDLVPAVSLADVTGVEVRQKPIRLLDER